MNTLNKGSSLDSFELRYEEMEFKKVQTSKKATAKPVVKTSTSAVKRKKVSLKDRVVVKLQPARKKFNNILKNLKNPRKKSKKTTKLSQKLARQQQKRGILGIGLLFVVVSITYSTYVTRTFVDSSASIVALFPQAAFALYTLFKAFSKIYK